ncbi:hypothetical protein ACFSFZ_16785, partial [Mixta tenebrionis]|uniref:hypothetical protein n=1 Tax=Mixta tenebrionis TaxID=2562439 RepID=UPI00363A6C8F
MKRPFPVSCAHFTRLAQQEENFLGRKRKGKPEYRRREKAPAFAGAPSLFDAWQFPTLAWG